jgi:hypothetical protein
MGDPSRPLSVPLSPVNFDGALGRQIVELHMKENLLSNL